MLLLNNTVQHFSTTYLSAKGKRESDIMFPDQSCKKYIHLYKYRNCVPETCPCKKVSFLNYVINYIKGFYIVEIEVVNQKRVRVFDRGIQTARNR